MNLITVPVKKFLHLVVELFSMGDGKSCLLMLIIVDHYQLGEVAKRYNYYIFSPNYSIHPDTSNQSRIQHILDHYHLHQHPPAMAYFFHYPLWRMLDLKSMQGRDNHHPKFVCVHLGTRPDLTLRARRRTVFSLGLKAKSRIQLRGILKKNIEVIRK